MWLSKFIARRRLKHLTQKHATLSPLQPNRRAVAELLVELMPEYFHDYEPIKGRARIEPLYPSIEIYAEKIKELCKTIKENRPIPPDWLDKANPQPMFVDQFFYSADGYYTSVGVSVGKFKLAGLELCKLMITSDTATYGVQEHNLRMLTKLFINLRVVSQRLVEVSLTKA